MPGSSKQQHAAKEKEAKDARMLRAAKGEMTLSDALDFSALVPGAYATARADCIKEYVDKMPAGKQQETALLTVSDAIRQLPDADKSLRRESILGWHRSD